MIAIDRDPTAIEAGRAMEKEFPGRLNLVESRFSALDEAVARMSGAGKKVDGVVLDIGVSSMQIDEAERGFSFQKDGPLDMRMSSRGQVLPMPSTASRRAIWRASSTFWARNVMQGGLRA